MRFITVFLPTALFAATVLANPIAQGSSIVAPISKGTPECGKNAFYSVGEQTCKTCPRGAQVNDRNNGCVCLGTGVHFNGWECVCNDDYMAMDSNGSCKRCMDGYHITTQTNGWCIRSCAPGAWAYDKKNCECTDKNGYTASDKKSCECNDGYIWDWPSAKCVPRK